METLEYRGYHTIIHFSPDDNCLYGKIEGIIDLVCFDGKTLEEAEQEFHDSVDEYIDFCKEIGKEPCSP